jgi:hypothetical protein
MTRQLPVDTGDVVRHALNAIVADREQRIARFRRNNSE